MKLLRGDMFNPEVAEACADVYLVTCNNIVTKSRRLVMGRGAAKKLTELFPDCDKRFGEMVVGNAQYGVLHYTLPYEDGIDDLILGIFQVKEHWHDPAKLELIRRSVKVLNRLARGAWQAKQISLNFPGIGNGKLERKAVLPLLLKLPDNVTIWEL